MGAFFGSKNHDWCKLVRWCLSNISDTMIPFSKQHLAHKRASKSRWYPIYPIKSSKTSATFCTSLPLKANKRRVTTLDIRNIWKPLSLCQLGICRGAHIKTFPLLIFCHYILLRNLCDGTQVLHLLYHHSLSFKHNRWVIICGIQDLLYCLNNLTKGKSMSMIEAF